MYVVKLLNNILVLSCFKLFSGIWFAWYYDLLMVQNLQDEMMDLMDVSSEIQESLGRSYNIPDGLDEDDLMGGKVLVL